MSNLPYPGYNDTIFFLCGNVIETMSQNTYEYLSFYKILNSFKRKCNSSAFLLSVLNRHENRKYIHPLISSTFTYTH